MRNGFNITEAEVATGMVMQGRPVGSVTPLSRAQIVHRHAIAHVSTVGRAQIVHRHAIAHVGTGIALWLERRTRD